jgi:hypothetical protein
MRSQAAELARRLARDAEAVCRRYLSNGRRQGRYWLVGDVANTPGRSLFVRLTGPDSGKGAAGKWTDAATGEHGDLLDVIAMTMGLDRLRDVLDEARAFLCMPRVEPPPDRRTQQPAAPIGSPESARRLFAMARPISGRSQKRICASAVLRLCTKSQRSASIPVAITGPMRTHRPRPGQR